MYMNILLTIVCYTKVFFFIVMLKIYSTTGKNDRPRWQETQVIEQESGTF